MVVDLMELLSQRSFSHPSRIVSAVLGAGEFQLTVTGFPWWRDAPQSSDERLILRFGGISSGLASLPGLLDETFTKALGDFQLIPTDQLEWAQPDAFSVFCSEPLPEPLAVYDAVEVHLQNANALIGAKDVLNGAERLATYLKYTASNMYLLAKGPECLKPVIVDELLRQNVSHHIEPMRGYSESRFLVTLSDTWFFCETATAEFTDASAA